VVTGMAEDGRHVQSGCGALFGGFLRVGV
jgi:hypothetical protein